MHSLSYFEHNPNGKSPLDEMNEADKHLKRWMGCFPKLKICLGNHDRLCQRKSFSAGIPDRAMRSFRSIWNFPLGWEDSFTFEIDGVRYMHGTGYSGQNAHIRAAEANRQSTVIGHTHSTLGGIYLVSERDRIFAVNTGCGIDRHSYAFQYGKDLPRKPALGCSVVTDRGTYWQTFAMDI